MSHVSEYQIKASDLDALERVLKRRGIPFKKLCAGEEVQQYARNTITGAAMAMKPQGWRYEIAVMPDGKLLYDHWGGVTGSWEAFTETIVEYNGEVVEDRLTRQGLTWWKTVNTETNEIEYEVEVS